MPHYQHKTQRKISSVVLNMYLSKTSREIRSQYFLFFLLFLVWPFGAFLFALYQYNERVSKIIFILFTGLFGYSLVAESSGLDLYRVMQLLPEASKLGFGEYFNNRGARESVDIYRDTVTFVVSRFTSNPKWLMCVLGVVAGIVYTKVLSLFLVEHSGKNVYTYLLVFSFSCIIGIDQLSGVRFSLAAYTFFLGAINVIMHSDKRYLIVAGASIFIHFSFLSVFLLLVVFLRLKNYPKWIYVILVLSLILPDLLHNYIIQYSAFLGGGIQARAELYNTLEGMDLNDTSWYVRYRIIVMIVFCYLALFITRIRKKTFHYSDKLNDLFFFSLTILSFVNFTLDIPHFGFRFQFIFIIFVFFYLYKIYTENRDSILISRLVMISLPFSLLMVVYTLRSTLFITPLSFYYFTLPGILFDQSVHSAWTTVFK